VARTAIVAVLCVVAAAALIVHPLVSLILFGAAGAVFFDGRQAFGFGRHRAMVAFLSGLWLGVVGAVATILGLVVLGGGCEAASCGGNFLILPGVLLLAAGLTLLAWSIVAFLRMRRIGQ
jgi:hypothetical protein